MANKWIDILRAVVRPYLAILIGSAIVALAVYLAIKYADADLARYVVTAVITAGTAIFSFYFGERAGKPKGDK